MAELMASLETSIISPSSSSTSPSSSSTSTSSLLPSSSSSAPSPPPPSLAAVFDVASPLNDSDLHKYTSSTTGTLGSSLSLPSPSPLPPSSAQLLALSTLTNAAAAVSSLESSPSSSSSSSSASSSLSSTQPIPQVSHTSILPQYLPPGAIVYSPRASESPNLIIATGGPRPPLTGPVSGSAAGINATSIALSQLYASFPPGHPHHPHHPHLNSSSPSAPSSALIPPGYEESSSMLGGIAGVKKMRRIKSATQLKILKAFFGKQPRPTKDDIKHLMQLCVLPHHEITRWFRNERHKEKKLRDGVGAKNSGNRGSNINNSHNNDMSEDDETTTASTTPTHSYALTQQSATLAPGLPPPVTGSPAFRKNSNSSDVAIAMAMVGASQLHNARNNNSNSNNTNNNNKSESSGSESESNVDPRKSMGAPLPSLTHNPSTTNQTFSVASFMNGSPSPSPSPPSTSLLSPDISSTTSSLSVSSHSPNPPDAVNNWLTSFSNFSFPEKLSALRQLVNSANQDELAAIMHHVQHVRTQIFTSSSNKADTSGIASPTLMMTPGVSSSLSNTSTSVNSWFSDNLSPTPMTSIRNESYGLSSLDSMNWLKRNSSSNSNLDWLDSAALVAMQASNNNSTANNNSNLNGSHNNSENGNNMLKRVRSAEQEDFESNKRASNGSTGSDPSNNGSDMVALTVESPGSPRSSASISPNLAAPSSSSTSATSSNPTVSATVATIATAASSLPVSNSGSSGFPVSLFSLSPSPSPSPFPLPVSKIFKPLSKSPSISPASSGRGLVSSSSSSSSSSQNVEKDAMISLMEMAERRQALQ